MNTRRISEITRFFIKNIISLTKNNGKKNINKTVITDVTLNTAEAFFDGIPLPELSDLAKQCYHGIKCTIDQYGFLVFHSTSNSGKTVFKTQMYIDETTGKLVGNIIHYPGQWKSSADKFVELFNNKYKN